MHTIHLCLSLPCVMWLSIRQSYSIEWSPTNHNENTLPSNEEALQSNTGLSVWAQEAGKPDSKTEHQLQSWYIDHILIIYIDNNIYYYWYIDNNILLSILIIILIATFYCELPSTRHWTECFVLIILLTYQKGCWFTPKGGRSASSHSSWRRH